jgi:hypothetical protein
VAVDVAKEPLLFAEVETGAANWGIILTVKDVGTGVLVAVSVTETGFVVPAGKITSAVV